jgi:hypothetical protein
VLGWKAQVGIYSNVIEVTPPLTLTPEEAERGLVLFEEALSDVEAGRVADETLGLHPLEATDLGARPSGFWTGQPFLRNKRYA